MDSRIAFSPKYNKILYNKWDKDGNGIVILDVSKAITTDANTMKRVSGSIEPISDDHFITRESLDEDYYNYSFTLRGYADPATKICCWKIINSKVTFEGDPRFRGFEHSIFWSRHPQTNNDNGRMFYLDTKTLIVREFELDWFNGRSYDIGYQGVREITKIPDQSKALIFVQRSNVVTEINLESGEFSHFSFPRLQQMKDIVFLRRNNIAVGYDTIFLIEKETYKIIRELKVQPETTQIIGGTTMPMSQFMGRIHADEDKGIIYAARPFSKDIVSISIKDFEIKNAFRSNFQPLYVYEFRDNLIAIDWHTLGAEKIPLNR